MRNNIKIFLSVIFILPLLYSNTFAHGGRLNSSGCHSGSEPYHCHNGLSNYRGNYNISTNYNNYKNINHKNNNNSWFWVLLFIIGFIYYAILNRIQKSKDKELEIINFVRNKYITKLHLINREILNKEILEERRIKRLVEELTIMKKVFSFDYINNSGIKSTRKIKPQSTNKQKLTVYGFCFLRKEKRHFKVKKITNLKIIKED